MIVTIKSSFGKAIRKVLAQGYKPLKGFQVSTFSTNIRDEHSFVEFIVVRDGDLLRKELRADIAISDIIFDPAFAKLLWGEDWEMRLSEMVTYLTTVERLKYLCEHLQS